MRDLVILLAYLVLIALPTVPLLGTWVVAIRERTLTRLFWRAGLPLVLCTASAAWFITWLFVPSVVGDNYTTHRFATIYTNLFIALAISGLGMTARGAVRIGLIVSSAAVASVWLYLAVVSAAV